MIQQQQTIRSYWGRRRYLEWVSLRRQGKSPYYNKFFIYQWDNDRKVNISIEVAGNDMALLLIRKYHRHDTGPGGCEGEPYWGTQKSIKLLGGGEVISPALFGLE